MILNAMPLALDRDALVRVGRVPYSEDALETLRTRLRTTHAVARSRNQIEVIGNSPEAELPGEIEQIALGAIPRANASLLSAWLIGHFTGLGRQVFRRRQTLILVSDRASDDLFPARPGEPPWLGLRVVYELNVRIEYPRTRPVIFLTVTPRVRPCLDGPVEQLIERGVPLTGLYVRRPKPEGDPRLSDSGRLTGCFGRVADGVIELSDYEDGWPKIATREATLEPRIEVLAHVFASLRPKQGDATRVLADLRSAADRISSGRDRLTRIKALAAYFQKQTAALAGGNKASFKLLCSPQDFANSETIQKPALIFDARASRTHRWNQGGLDQHGPLDRYQFNPKRLNIAVICRQDRQGRVEQYVQQLLQGVSGIDRGGDVGLLRRFSLEQPYVNVFAAKNATPEAYRLACVNAAEHIADRNESWNLALIQTDESMELLAGEHNPYLTTKAFWLARDVAVQHVHFETMSQHPAQRAFSLNNIGLACYAKLGGVPWVLPSDRSVTHELLVGLGSHHEKASRFGGGDRFVGVTTVFSGDGRYLLEGRTRAVPFSEYGTAMLSTVQAAIERLRGDFAWDQNDPVRLIFHVFKPIKDAEAHAMTKLMRDLRLPHARFAFVHLAESHPYDIFDETENGAASGGQTKKGVFAPPRGLALQLSNHDALLCMKGAKELKRAGDGHPSPIALHLHKESSFRDLTYLTRQVFALSCSSWRSFLPAPTPITVLYSQLMAGNIRELASLPTWKDDSISGRVGRTPWFL